MNPPRPSHLVKAWFELTPGEQRAALLILALFVLGVIARCLHAVGRL